jgi:hypothetical protein
VGRNGGRLTEHEKNARGVLRVVRGSKQSSMRELPESVLHKRDGIVGIGYCHYLTLQEFFLLWEAIIDDIVEVISSRFGSL